MKMLCDIADMLRDAWRLCNAFTAFTLERSPAELFLIAEGIAFQRRGDGTLYVKQSIKIGGVRSNLPDLSNVMLDGSFECENLGLVSLKGAPRIVTGDFLCGHNSLETLEGAPQEVGGSFNCQSNRLVSLRGAPRRVGRHFRCCLNRLETLVGGPGEVETYACTGNKLRSLKGAEAARGKIMSDFPNYASWADVPPHIRATPEEHAEAQIAIAGEATVLQARTLALKPLKFRKS
jgi:hypothetical protein